MSETESASEKEVPEGQNIKTMQEFVIINSDETNAKLFSLLYIGNKEEENVEENTTEENTTEENNDDTADDMDTTEETIYVPEKNEIGKYYEGDFTLKSRKEAGDMVRNKIARFAGRSRKADFFVYSEKKRILIPFKKNDYIAYDNGYFTYDGKNYIHRDNNGIERRRASYSDRKDISKDE